MKEYEIGIFFNLEEMSRRRYSAEAWDIFICQCRPAMLRSSQLFHGEVAGYMPGVGHAFCIAVRTTNLSSIQYLKDAFGECDDIRLAAPLNRVRESDIISKFRLKYRGRVDSKGRLKTKKWNRTDHDACKSNGWPYVPRDHPEYLSPELMEELERMERPEFGLDELQPSKSAADNASSSSDRNPRKITRKITPKELVQYASLAALIVLFAIIYLAGDRISQHLRTGKELLVTRRILGGEGYQKYREGFAMANIVRIPQGLDLQELNGRLQSKAYHATRWAENSPVDTWIDCSVWFASNESRDSLSLATTQAFIRINMKSLDGNVIWVCQGKGTTSLPGSEADNERLRQAALHLAIENLDLSCLPDGRSVKNFQAGNDFAALKRHVNYLLALSNRDPEKQSAKTGKTDVIESPKEKKQPPAQAAPVHVQPARESPDSIMKRQCDELKAELVRHLADQWIMTHKIYLNTGRTLNALVLEEKRGILRLRLPGGTVSVSRAQIKRIEPLDIKEVTDNVARILNKARKGFDCAWQHRTCNTLENEFSKKCFQYGPPLPGASLLALKETGENGELEAIVRSGEDEVAVKKGGVIAGFEIIDMDRETDSLLVRLGEGGDVLRIYSQENTTHGSGPDI